jgi:nucleotide-binding universal stress UspA family protein
MSTLTIPASEPRQDHRAPRGASLLVATDGREQSDAALVAGQVFADDVDAYRIVSVLPPLPVVSPEVQLPVSPELEAARADELSAAVMRQIARVLGPDEHPEVEILSGDPSHTIAHAAHECGARLVIAGIGRHRVVDRFFGDETALRLLRVAPVPVLAVTPGFSRPPRNVVVAMDFSAPSIRAAHVAISLAADAALVHLVHVMPRDSAVSAENGWGPSYKDDAESELARLAKKLQAPRGMVVQRVVLQGDPATELLAFATKNSADLIATGSHGHGFIARLLIGSVVTKIVRASPCTVLAVPPVKVMEQHEHDVAPRTGQTLLTSSW